MGALGAEGAGGGEEPAGVGEEPAGVGEEPAGGEGEEAAGEGAAVGEVAPGEVAGGAPGGEAAGGGEVVAPEPEPQLEPAAVVGVVRETTAVEWAGHSDPTSIPPHPHPHRKKKKWRPLLDI